MVMEYATAEEMIESYKQIRKRLYEPKLVIAKPTVQKKIRDVSVAKPVEPPKPDPIVIDGFVEHRGKTIIKAVLNAYGMTKEEVFQLSRKKKYIYIRHEIWAKLREANYSYLQIAALTFFQKLMDHTTVMNGVKSYKKRMERESKKQC
jgi:hypothetical protein